MTFEIRVMSRWSALDILSTLTEHRFSFRYSYSGGVVAAYIYVEVSGAENLKWLKENFKGRVLHEEDKQQLLGGL